VRRGISGVSPGASRTAAPPVPAYRSAISTATIAAYVSLGGLGRFVFDGLAREDYSSVAGGAVLVAALALLSEAVFVIVQRAVVSPGIRQRG